MVFPAAALDFGCCVGDLPGRHWISVLHRPQSVSARRRQLLHSRRVRRAGRLVARSDAGATKRQAEKVMQANPAVETTFTMSGNSQFMPANQGFLHRVSEGSVEAPADRSGRRAADGRYRHHPSRGDCLPPAEPGVGDQHGSDGEHARAVRLRDFRYRSRTSL